MNRILTALLAVTALAQPAAAGDPPLPTQASAGSPSAADFRHVGSYLVSSRLKITDDRVTRIALKPLAIDVFTNGVELRLVAASRDDATANYQLYRTDGIGRLNGRTGVLEVVPGLQASSSAEGILRHVRVTREALTITQFSGMSNQTLVTHAVAAPARATVVADTAAADAGLPR
jgi:hypothetical protein